MPYSLLVKILLNYTLLLLSTPSHTHSGKWQESNLSMLLNNRAASQLKLGNCPACIVDCTESLSLVVVNKKALMRRGKAFELLEK